MGEKRKRKPQVVWMPEQDGHLWFGYAADTRRQAVANWLVYGEGGMSWADWLKDRPTLRVVKVQLVPVEAPDAD